MDKGRVETFSDGVFAIAITLLVLTIAQPSDFGRLAHQLVNRWPSLAAYVVSFTVIGIMWVNHHTIFTHLRVVNRGLFYFNLLLLMTIVFIPYPTEVFGEALSRRHGATTAAVFYSATMTINALAWTSLWLYASVGRRLLNWDFPEQQRRVSTILFISGGAFYAISIGVAYINPYLCLAFHAVLAIYYAFDPISRRVALEAQPLKTHATKDDIVLAIHAAPSLVVAIDSGRPTPAPQAVSISSGSGDTRLPPPGNVPASRSGIPTQHIDNHVDAPGVVEDFDGSARAQRSHSQVGPDVTGHLVEVRNEG